jgi:hypothetical protein
MHLAADLVDGSVVSSVDTAGVVEEVVAAGVVVADTAWAMAWDMAVAGAEEAEEVLAVEDAEAVADAVGAAEAGAGNRTPIF